MMKGDNATIRVSAGLFLAALLAGVMMGGGELSPPGSSGSPVVTDGPNVVLVVVNNLRMDRLSCYGHHRNTTPHLCRFADDSIRFTNAIAQSPWTIPSTASLFTSQYPDVHGVTSEERRISDDTTTFTEIFRRNSYETAAFVGNKRCRGGHLKARYGYGQGFDTYTQRGPWFNTSVPQATRWLEQDSRDPFFLFVHGYDPHGPYGDATTDRTFAAAYDGVLSDVILDWRENDSRRILDDIRRWNGSYTLELPDRTVPLGSDDISYIRAQYDRDVAAADEQIGDLLRHLREAGRYEDSIIVVMSNHGEMLGERGRGQLRWVHSFPYEAVVNIPLFIHIPGEEGRTIGTPVELIDLFPTLLDLAGITDRETRQEVQGNSLTPLLSGGPDGHVEEYVYAQGNGKVVRNRTWKLVRTQDPAYSSEDLYFRIDGDGPYRVPDEMVPAGVAEDMQSALERRDLLNRQIEDSSAPVEDEIC